MRKIRSFVFLSFSFVLVMICAVFVVLASLISVNAVFTVARFYARSLNWMLKFFCGIDVVYEKQEELPETPCVVLLKHSSPWETIGEFLAFPPCVIVLKRELMWIPIFGWCLAALKSIAINRKAGRSAVKQVLHKGKQRLSEGFWVMIFPEGTRVPKGTLGRFGMSGFRLACEAQVPVVPVAHNAGDHWPSGQLEKIPGTITMRVGPALDTKGKTMEQVSDEARQWMESAMADLSPSHRQQ